MRIVVGICKVEGVKWREEKKKRWKRVQRLIKNVNNMLIHFLKRIKM